MPATLQLQRRDWVLYTRQMENSYITGSWWLYQRANLPSLTIINSACKCWFCLHLIFISSSLFYVCARVRKPCNRRGRRPRARSRPSTHARLRWFFFHMGLIFFLLFRAFTHALPDVTSYIIIDKHRYRTYRAYKQERSFFSFSFLIMTFCSTYRWRAGQGICLSVCAQRNFFSNPVQ